MEPTSSGAAAVPGVVHAKSKDSFAPLKVGIVSDSRPLADTYMQMGFTSTAGTLTNGSAAAVEFNIHAQNWGNYQEANDYSYMSSVTRFDWNRVTVYRNGMLVWGTEP